MPGQTSRQPCYYPAYLRLDLLLSAQQPESEALGRPAHDEMLFIIVHQAYELWFKQMLHELGRIRSDFSAAPLDDRRMLRIVGGLQRIEAIWKLVIQQVDVLETMTPLDFLDFRDLLVPASGFQSLQFRELEARFGMPSSERPTIDGPRRRIAPVGGGRAPAGRCLGRAQSRRPGRFLAFAHAVPGC